MGMRAWIARLLGKTARRPSLLAADQARADLAKAARSPEHPAPEPEGLHERMEAKLVAQRTALGSAPEHEAD